MQDSNTTSTPPAEGNTPPVPNPAAVNTPPREEGVPNTRPESPDQDLTAFFGDEAKQFTEFVEKEAGGVTVTMTEPVKPDEQPPASGTEAPPAQPDAQPPAAGEQPPTAAPVTYTQEQFDATLNERLTEEVKKFQNIDAFFNEWQKDPYGFMAKNAPHLFQKFDKEAYISSKLKEEFGEEYAYDPSRGYMVGTTDYNYRKRVEDLDKEADSLSDQAKNTLAQQDADMAQAETSYKTAKAQALGMDAITFESKIWTKIKGMDQNSVLDAVIDSVIYKEKLAETSSAIKTQIDLTKVVPSPANVSGVGKPMEGDKELAWLRSQFGDVLD